MLHLSDGTLRQCVECIISYKVRTCPRGNPGKAEVLNFTSQFTRQPSFGESITFSIAMTKIDSKYTEILALASS